MSDIELTIESEESLDGRSLLLEEEVRRGQLDAKSRKKNYSFNVLDVEVVSENKLAEQCIKAVPDESLKVVGKDFYKSRIKPGTSIYEFPVNLFVDKKELYKVLANKPSQDQLDMAFQLRLRMPFKPLLGKRVVSEVRLPSKDKDYALTVKFRRRVARMTLQIIWPVENKKNKLIIYRKNQKKPLCAVKIANKPDLLYAYSLNVKDLQFSLKDKKTGRVSYCLEVGEKLENHKSAGKDDYGYYLNELPPGRHTIWQLNIDFSKLKYDHELTEYELLVEGSVRENGHDYFEFGQRALDRFKIDWDQQEAEMVIRQLDGADFADVADGQGLTASTCVYSAKDTGNHTVVSGLIANQATTDPTKSELTGVKVKNAQMVFAIMGTNLFKSGRDINEFVKTSFEHKGNPVKKTNAVLLKNEPDSVVEFNADIDLKALMSALDRTKENKTQVRGTLTFDYNIIDAVDGHGQERFPKFQKVTKSFNFEIRQFAGNDWIVVDVGTSAHVAIKRTRDDTMELLDLHNRFKDELAKDILEAGENRDIGRAQFEEADTKFLSSTVLLWPTHQGKKLHLWEDLVMLSPDIPYMQASSDNVLPYLKALIGNKELPESFIEKLDPEDQEAAEKVTTDQVVERIYGKLLNRILKAPKETNKLTLTIPTLFSHRQIEVVKSVVDAALPNIWEDHLVLVRESDAVAWYYFNNYSRLIKETVKVSDQEASKLVEQRSESDRVLVYDMGAGTIDLTLFEVKTVGKRRSLKMLARVGIPKAGNYLDYILARALLLVMQDHSDKMVDGKKVDFEELYAELIQDYQSNKGTAIPFKRFIKSELKPALSQDEFNFVYEPLIGGFEDAEYLNDIDPQTLINHEEYTAYLSEVTNDLIQLLGRNAGKRRLQIDTLVLSGRGVQIPKLEKGLLSAINKTFKSSPLVIKPESEKLKSIVAEGAGHFARFERGKAGVLEELKVPARFGLLSHYSGGIQKYIEHVSPDSDLDEGGVLTSAGTVTKKLVVELAGVKKIEVVQTFETEEKVNEIVYDQIALDSTVTRLMEFNDGHQYHTNEAETGVLWLRVNANGELTVKLNGVKPDPVVMSSIDLERNPIYKRSMWPFL